MSKVLTGMDHSGAFRVYLAVTTDLVEEARKIHNTTPLATAGLGRVLTGAGIMGLLLKNTGDKLTLLFKGDGPAKQILATATQAGEVKGYIANPDVELPLTEAGKLDVGTVFDVIGEFVNKGKDAVLDATKTAVTTVAILLRNEGTANYDDMTVASGGTSNNSGYEKGDILTVANGGQHTNSGTSIWNNVTVQTGATSTVDVGGKETINDTYDIAGDHTNKGEVDATKVANTQVSGTLDNQGTSNYDDMTVASGGTSNNSGFEKGDILTIEDGGEHTNSGTSIWNNQTVHAGFTRPQFLNEVST